MYACELMWTCLVWAERSTPDNMKPLVLFHKSSENGLKFELTLHASRLEFVSVTDNSLLDLSDDLYFVLVSGATERANICCI